jgi:hypothetical protein
VITTEPGAPAAKQATSALPSALILVGITAVALALRLPSFDDSLWMDEIGTNYVVHGFGVGSVLDIVSSDQEGTPPLFFLLAWVTKDIGGPEGLRWVSLAAGLGAIPLTYLLGLWTIGRQGATVGALLLAVSPFQIFYATEGRAYELVMFFCLAASVTLLLALSRDNWWWWVAYALSSAAAIYTHYNAIFVLGALLVWAFFARPEARRALVAANLGAIVLFAPWFGEFLKDKDSTAAKLTEALHPLTLANVKLDLGRWSVGHPFTPTADVPGHLAMVLIGAGLLLGAAGLALRIGRGGFERIWPPRSGVVLVAILAAAAPVGAAVYSLFGDTIFTFRALITSWPGLALAMGGLVMAGLRPIRIVAATLLVGGYAIGGVKMLDQDHQRPDLARVAEYIERNGEPGSPVVEVPQPTPGIQTPMEAALAPQGEALPPDRRVLPLGFPTFGALLDARRRDLPALTPLPIPPDQDVARRAAALAGTGTLFLVTTGTGSIEELRSLPGPAAGFLAALPPRFHEIGSRSVPGVSFWDVTVHVLRGDGGRTEP